ncbi:MAG: SOS response-associated peptidase [Bacteroidota bacterium]
MCFTIEVHLTRKTIEKRFPVETSALYDFDFNYFYKAFTNPMLPVISQEMPYEVRLMEWGLIPAWAADRKKAEQLRKGTYNARAETLQEKPSFREPLRKGRCLVIAHGFFEWQLINGVKIPWYISLKNDKPFAFAGLYDIWNDPEGENLLYTFSIITTAANRLMEKIHNTKKRMPVILSEETENQWISGDISLHKINKLLLPYNEADLQAYTVSPSLSHPHINPQDPDIIKPYDHLITGKLF